MIGKLGHFELIELIGRGGMGKVFRAFDPSLNRTVAIKILDEVLAEDPQFVADFLREAQSAAAISHPHIVQIYFVGSENGQYFLAMEFLNGNPLSRLLQEAGPLSEGRVLKISIEAVTALRAAYDRQMIHGDIKPQNLFITDSAGVKLCDFGLAKLANAEVPQTDSVWGSAFYIPPERVQKKPEDFRSDVYSLGATMFETLTGNPPYDAETADEVAALHIHEPIPSLRAIKPAISEHTEQIVTKMLDKSPLLRYQDYSYLLRDLRDAEAAISEDETIGAKLRRTAAIQVAPASRTPTFVLVASITAVVLAAVAIAFVVLQRKAPPPVGASASHSTSPLAVANASRSALSRPVADRLGAKKTASKFQPKKPRYRPKKGKVKVKKGKSVADTQPADDPVEAESPVETPTPSATATPMIIDLEAIANSPREQWPESVALKEPTAFPATLDGKIVGEIQLPAGTQVNVVSVQAKSVTVEYHNGKQQLPANATDLIERFKRANPH